MNKLANLKIDIKKELVSTLLFSILFVVSLFSSIVSFAQTLPFNINNAEILEKSPNTVGNIEKINKDEIVNNITFHKVNDYVVYKLNIKSNMENQITILSINDDNENECIEYEYDKHENEMLNASSSFDFIVKVTYKKELVDITKRNQTNNVKFKIKYLEDNKEKEGEIIINPKTGDNLYKNYIVLFISSIGLILCITRCKNKKRKNKKLSKVAIFIITGVIITPIMTKAATTVFNVSIKTTISLFDKVIVTYIVDNQEKTLVNIFDTKVTELETPEKVGYTFVKWVYEDGTDFKKNDPVTEDIKIFAQFNANNYIVEFDGNKGIGEMSNQEMTYNIKKSLTKNTYKRTGYNFKGWNTKADGSGKSYDDEEEVQNLATSGNIKLYAMWELNIKVGDVVNYKAYRSSSDEELNLNYKYCVPNFETDAETGDTYFNDSISCDETYEDYIEFNSKDTVIWRVLSIDKESGKIELVGTKINHKISILGDARFENYMNIMSSIANVYGHGYGAESSRMISIEDIKKYSNYDSENYEGGQALSRYGLGLQVFPYGEKKKFEDSYLYKENINNDGIVEGYRSEKEYIEQYNATSTYYEYNANDYINNEEIYKLLFLEDNNDYKSYWLASQTGIVTSYDGYESSHIIYGARVVNNGMITAGYITTNDYLETGDAERVKENDNFSVTPIVTLSSNINLIYDEELELWNIDEIEKPSYIIKYDSSEIDYGASVSGTMNSQVINYGEKVKLNKNQYNVYGYDFMGWSTKKIVANPSNYEDDDIYASYIEFDDESEIKNLSVNGEIKLYAVWRAHITTIKFDKNSQNATGKMNNQTCNIPNPYSDFCYNNWIYYVNEGYTFEGWNTKPDGSGTSYKPIREYKEYYMTYIKKTELANIDEITLYAQWKESKIGDVVNYSVTINENQILDNWKILDTDEEGYTYLIYGDYLPNSAVPQSLIDSGKIGIYKTYSVFGMENRDNFVSVLKDSNNWSDLITLELKNASERINKTATATGTPTVTQFVNSWNKKYPKNPIIIRGDEEFGYYYYNIAQQNSGYNDLLYFPHKNYYKDTSGYWFASKTGNYGEEQQYSVVSLFYSGGLNNPFFRYQSSDEAIRPIICIPSSLLVRNGDGLSWDINYLN